MIEFFLVQQDESGASTDFFDGKRIFYWPADTLSHTVPLAGTPVNIASRQALAKYRTYHPEIEAAYQEFQSER